MKNKSILSLLLAALLALSCLSAFAENTAIPTVETDVADIQKYGNLVLSMKASSLLDLGYDYGDIISVNVLDKTVEMPVGSNYSDVDSGSMVCRLVLDEASGTDDIILAINMGDLATTLGIATKESIEAEPGYQWNYTEGVETPVAVSIAMQDKGGYANEYLIRQLSRSNERADYPDLSDEEYANFRVIATTGMGKGVLYRSSNPANPKLNRNKEADEALNNAGIAAIMNLADSEEALTGYEDYATSYYAQRKHIALNMGVDFAAEENKEKLAEGLRFLIANEGPYLVHCTEGKDRAGFVSALLECLMGATAEELQADYMTTYYNYYGVEQGTEAYDAIWQGFQKSLAAALGIPAITDDADIPAATEGYLQQIGLSAEEIAALKAKLATDFE